MKMIFLIFCMTASQAASAQKINLGLQLRTGQIYLQSITDRSVVNEQVEGKEVVIDVSAKATIAYEITGVRDSVYQASVSYKKFAMEFRNGERRVEFSTVSPNADDKMSKILSLLIDQPFHVTLNKRGKILSCENFDTVWSELLSRVKEITPDQRLHIKEMILKSYGEKAFRGNFNMLTSMFPAKAVSVHDKWKISTQMETQMAAKLVTTYELLGSDGEFYHIAGNGLMQSADKDAYVDVDGMPARYDLTGTMISDLMVSKETGWINSGTIEQKIQGTATIKPNDRMPDGLVIPLTMTGDITVSGAD